MAEMQQLEVYRNRGGELAFTVVLNGEPFDGILNADVYFTAKHSYSDPHEEAAIAKRSTNDEIEKELGEEAKVTVLISPADTAEFPARNIGLVFDLTVVPLGLDPKTVAEGTLTVKPEVTTVA